MFLHIPSKHHTSTSPLSKRLSAMGWANAVDINIDIEARAKLMKFEVVPEPIRVAMGSGIPWI